MAGSYNHAVDEQTGALRHWRDMSIATETPGDAYETIEEMYGMIWFLAQGDAGRVAMAQRYYKVGIEMSPGSADPLPPES